jgi:nitrile hydratase accessory protein
LNRAEAIPTLSGSAAIPRAADGPAFPTPWAARAFALAVALEARGVFTWGEWAEALGPAVAVEAAADPGDAEAYWRAWLAALENVLAAKRVVASETLHDLQEAWRRAAEAAPHGEPIALSDAAAARAR